MLGALVTIQILATSAAARVAQRVSHRLRSEDGQTSAEYALVLLGAASVALLVVAWARSSGKIGDLLDSVFDNVTNMVTS